MAKKPRLKKRTGGTARYKPQPKAKDLPDLPEKQDWFSTAETAHYTGLTPRRIATFANEGRVGRRTVNPITKEQTRNWEFKRAEVIELRTQNRQPGNRSKSEAN